MAKTDLFLIAIICFCCSIQLVRAAAFSTETFVLTINVGANNFLYEYDISGNKLQEISVPGRGPLRLDENNALMTLCASLVNKDSVFVINAKGGISDTTDFPSGSGACSAVISNQDLWYVTSSKLYWTTRGSAAAATQLTNILTLPSTMQRIGTQLYLLDFRTLKLMDPVLNSPPVTFTNIFPSDALEYYIFQGNIYIITSDTQLKKFSISATGEIGASALWTYTAAGQNMRYIAPFISVSQEELVVMVAMYDGSSKWKVVRLYDSGISYSTTDIVTGLSGVYGMSVTPQPTCSDGVADQDETDVDCGGAKCSKCDAGKYCLVARDCSSGVCNIDTLKCDAPSCNDGIKNQDETDVDCGGSNCVPCAPGKVCGGDADCSSGVCTSNVCAIPTCLDNVLNGAETDVDCGGNSCPGCTIGQECNGDGDCYGGNCESFICAASCGDGIKNQDETDVDCGGSCEPCVDDKMCAVNNDCDSGFCNINSICKTPTCQDNTKNQDETDVDCGGNTCSKCALDKDCNADSDCDSNTCSGDVCVNPPMAPVDTPVSAPVSDAPQSAPTTAAPTSSTTPIKPKPVSSATFVGASVFGAVIAGVALVL